MPLLMVQQISRVAVSGPTPSTGGAGSVLVVFVLSVLLAATLLLLSDLRQQHEASGATLADEAERWLGERHLDQ
jgi:hypothetical protein